MLWIDELNLEQCVRWTEWSIHHSIVSSPEGRANKIWASGWFMHLIVVGLATVGNLQKHSLCTRSLLQMLTIVPLSVLVCSLLLNMAKVYSGLHSKCLQIAPSPLLCSGLLFSSVQLGHHINVFSAWPDGLFVKYWMHCGQLEYQYKNRMPKQETRILQRTQGQSLSPVYNIKFTNYR